MNELHETHMSARARTSWGAFVVTFLVVFFVSFALLDVIGLTPSPSSASTDVAETQSPETSGPSVEMTTEPVRVIAEKIGLNEEILNPERSDIQTLDSALLKGVVRYPGSALLGEDANMLLFGHSSYLPFVYNSNYKAFNDIQKLAIGDVIQVQSDSIEYRYQVTSVGLIDSGDAVIDLTPGTRKLTLSTCNSFGAKSERFVVEAMYVGSRSL